MLINKIAYFGYGYYNHSDPKWYAISQYLIWKEADPLGHYYFTEGLNGLEANKFQEEINEINQLINEYDKDISFNNKTIDLSE